MKLIATLVGTLPASVRTFLVAQLGKDCYRRLLVEVEPFTGTAGITCTKLAVSKALGMGIVAGGSLVKLPQIAKIVKARSAHGLSLLAYLLETTAYCITLAYNTRHRHPFSTYGETVFVAGQNAIILALMLALRGRYLALCVMLVAGVLAQTALYGEQYVSMAVLGRLQATTIPITLASKLPQIWSNYRQGSTGQLSAITVFLFLGGSLARIFTTMQEVRDPLILTGFLLATVLNAVLAAQMAWYWRASSKGASSSEKGPTGMGARTRSQSPGPARRMKRE